MEKRNAAGFIETKGLLGGIAALDAALKAASVVLSSFSKVRGGRMMSVLEGDVASVTAAVDAGSAVAAGLHCLRARHVIPFPDEQTSSMFQERVRGSFGSTNSEGGSMRRGKDAVARGLERGAVHNYSDLPKLEECRTADLRRILRARSTGRCTGREISLMRKDQLLKLLRETRNDE